jgi:hypothetical protein
MAAAQSALASNPQLTPLEFGAIYIMKQPGGQPVRCMYAGNGHRLEQTNCAVLLSRHKVNQESPQECILEMFIPQQAVFADLERYLVVKGPVWISEAIHFRAVPGPEHSEEARLVLQNLHRNYDSLDAQLKEAGL